MHASISILSVLNQVNHLLALAVDASHKKINHKVLIRCNQVLTLLHLLKSTDFEHKHHVDIATKMIRLIQRDLHQQEPSSANDKATANQPPALTQPSQRGVMITPHGSEPSSPQQNHSSFQKVFPIECFLEKHLVTFQDIVGCDRAKQLLEENVVLQLKLPEAIKSKVLQGIRSGVGNVLLHGPPGTGKTLLAQAVANEANATYITVRPSDILSKYQGDSEKFVHQLFEAAKKFERAVLFFDEFDSIATSRRSSEDNGQSRRLLSELLLQLSKLHIPATKNKKRRLHIEDHGDVDGSSESLVEERRTEGMESSNRLVVIAATNRIEDIDEAVIRRFESKVFVGVPSKAGRKCLIMKFLQGIHHALSDSDLEHIGDITYGWSGSDIETVAREAAMIPFREFRQQCSPDFITSLNQCDSTPIIRPLQREDFEIAATTIVRTHMEVVDEDDDLDNLPTSSDNNKS